MALLAFWSDLFNAASDTAIASHTPETGTGYTNSLFQNKGGTVAATEDAFSATTNGQQHIAMLDDTASTANIDITFSVVYKVDLSQRGVGIVFRWTDSVSASGYQFRTKDGSSELWSYNNGSADLLDTVVTNFTVDTEHTIRIRMISNAIAIWLDGDILTWVDAGSTLLLNSAHLSSHAVGIWSNSAVTVCYMPSISGGYEDAEAIALADISNYRVFQRSGTSKSITLTGVYTGATTGIEARVVEHGTSTEVVTWTTITSNAINGEFSGTLTDVPQGGWYNVQVRYKDNTSVSAAGSAPWGIGDILLIIGQSHAQDMDTEGTGGVPHPFLVRFDFLTDTWDLYPTTGTGGIQLGNDHIANVNVPVCIFNRSVGGTALIAVADGGAGYWLDTSATSRYTKTIAEVQYMGGDIAAVIWWQGDRDAESGLVNKEEYIDGLEQLATNLRSDIDTSLRIYLVPLGSKQTDSYSPDWQAIRNAQYTWVPQDGNAVATPHSLDLAQVDGQHLTDESLETMGARIASALNGESGPTLDIISTLDNQNFDINLTHSGGATITPLVDITGFIIKNDSVNAKITSVVFYRDNAIRLTTESALDGEVIVNYLYGAKPDITGAVLDDLNNTLAPIFGSSVSFGLSVWGDIEPYSPSALVIS